MYSTYWNHHRRKMRSYFCDYCQKEQEMFFGLIHPICGECGFHPDINFRCDDYDCGCTRLHPNPKKRKMCYSSSEDELSDAPVERIRNYHSSLDDLYDVSTDIEGTLSQENKTEPYDGDVDVNIDDTIDYSNLKPLVRSKTMVFK